MTRTGVVLTLPGETVRIDSWGDSTFRVRAGTVPVTSFDLAMAEDAVATAPSEVQELDDRIVMHSGDLRVSLELSGRISFFRGTEPLVAEPPFDPREPPLLPHRRFHRSASGLLETTMTFDAYEGESFYGLGQHSLPHLNLKGCALELLHRNTYVSIPAVISSRGYGMLWNTPSVGQVEFATNHTRWHARAAREIDYFIYSGNTPAQVLRRYHTLTGFAPKFPHWATGYWQSKSYYESQEELMAVAREHLSRGLPLTAIFVDYMHWTHMGNWDWDRELWPDPAAMVAELAENGVRVLVSVWPHVSPLSENHAQLQANGQLVLATGADTPAVFSYADRGSPAGLDLSLLDLTNSDARGFLWDRLRRSYSSIGISSFWLDACEPEIRESSTQFREETMAFSSGPGGEVTGSFPLHFAQAVREGLTADGLDDGMILIRSAWAGSQRYGAAVWSGDIQSTWEALQGQLSAGLGMMVSGIPWWTSDIGGFFDSDIESPYFRELVVRWFQFAVLWPVFRLHGNRHADFYNAGLFSTGDPNEVWSFGDEAYEVIRGLLAFRERIRPYLQEQMDLATSDGLPPVRPLWFAYPDDESARGVDDQFLLGTDLLAAPIVHAGAIERTVYFPSGDDWRDVWSGMVFAGGSFAEIAAPIDRFPLFERVGGELGVTVDWFVASESSPREA
jgi:alpha-D-xyloside xylohydrolase